MNIEKIIIDKIDEINEEYNVIVRNSPDNGYKLENINILAHQKEAMNKVLNELLTEVKKLPDYKKLVEHLKTLSLGTQETDYNYEDEIILNFEYFDWDYYIENWFEVEKYNLGGE